MGARSPLSITGLLLSPLLALGLLAFPATASADDGCIEVVVATEDSSGNDLYPVESFTAVLDGRFQTTTDSGGRARFRDVDDGSHTVSLASKRDWLQVSVSPTNGRVSTDDSACRTVRFRMRQTSDNRAQCRDGVDNDNDGRVDYPDDLDCTDRLDDSERGTSGGTYRCNDGIDNDLDGEVDYPDDEGCASRQDDDERDSRTGAEECDDNRDNDNDGRTDYPADSGCASRRDDSERTSGSSGRYQCDDGRDNDGDGRYDYPEDSGCSSRTDNSEGGSNVRDGRVRVSIGAESAEALPGGYVYYTAYITNGTDDRIYDTDLENTFDSSQLTVTDSGGGDVSGGTIRWRISSLDEGESRSFRYRVQVSRNLANGATLHTSAYARGSFGTASASTSIRLIGQLPQTGVDLKAYLAATSSPVGALPPGAWAVIGVAGLLAGVLAARRLVRAEI